MLQLPDTTPVTWGVVRELIADVRDGHRRLEQTVKEVVEDAIERLEQSSRERSAAMGERVGRLEQDTRAHHERLQILENDKRRLLDARWIAGGVLALVAGGISVGWLVLDRLDDAIAARKTFDARIERSLKE